MTPKTRQIARRAGHALALAVALATPPQFALSFEARLTSDAVDSVDSALRAASRTLTARADKVTNPQDIVTAAKADYHQLTATLYGYGYYGGVVNVLVDGREAATISPLEVPANVKKVEIRIASGPLFRFGQAEVAPLAPGTTLPEAFTPGEPARLPAIQEAATTAIEGWRQASHAKAAIANERVIARHPGKELDVGLTVDPGPALTFGSFAISGNTKVRTARVRRIAGFPTGKPFDPDALDTSAKRLRRSGPFRSVVLREADTPNTDGTLDVEVTLVEEKPRRFGFGAEVSSLEGLRATGYWMHRNLFGGAERLRIDGEIAGVGSNTGTDYELTARLSRPATIWTDTTGYAEISGAVLDEPDYYSKQVSLEFGFDILISDQLNSSIGLGYRFSDVRDDLGDRTFNHLILPVTTEWDLRDNAFDAHRGTYLNFEALPFVGLRGSASGARFYADGRAYRQLGVGRGLVLAGRLQLGSVVAAGLAETPPDLLFHSGGGGTVRGQPYQSLGVDLGGGDQVGGRSFLGASAEVRMGVTDTISVVGFYDAGWIGAGSVPGEGAMHSGMGLGLRYATGIGPIRLDVAKPVSGGASGGFQIYVGIGQAF